MHNAHPIVELCVSMIIGFVTFTPSVTFVLWILFEIRARYNTFEMGGANCADASAPESFDSMICRHPGAFKNRGQSYSMRYSSYLIDNTYQGD
uniref:Uncharacterized protein n=1 Tax=Candidatus Methanogaster sp. ANME-2c ERB4 TaxID=2759911 RepID=A0A7G9YFD7_9EURY|nr:hypothetical protein EIOBDEGA_00009 [Methanosarcinales archaeon ANME-2c ERB4]